MITYHFGFCNPNKCDIQHLKQMFLLLMFLYSFHKHTNLMSLVCNKYAVLFL